MTETQLFAPVVSITSTKRRRFFWAAWWSGPPVRVPFRKPDASDGGAETYDDAIAAANARARAAAELGSAARGKSEPGSAGRVHMTVTDPLWARAWMRILRGQDAFPTRASREPASRRATPVAEPGSIWELLGVAKDATLTELKAAYRKRAIELHPDRGGDAETFRRLLAAYEEAKRRVARPKSARRAPPR